MVLEIMSSERAITGIGALRACVDARGPTGGIGADGSGSSRFLEADRQKTISIMGDFRLDADLGPACASECDFRT